MMKLLPKALRKQLPPLYATEHEEDPMVWCRFFYPFSMWSWYVTEFDGNDIFFGLVEGFEVELGYFSLAEMVKTRDAKGYPIERDLAFQPCRLSKVRAAIEQAQQARA